MHIIGTAGHIDHGKSSLVKALTGVDPDRLPEEKARGMTIELGFARLDLGDGIRAGMIDVPGHERFIRHMLAGVGGIDAALLAVAADETVMPQTREHLAILDLLDLQHGVVALTKCDLVDEEWLVLAIEEVRSALAGTALADSLIVPCSSRTGAGLDDLRAALRVTLAGTPERNDHGRPHLPIDRVFTRSGYGTIVTGTLLEGALNTGQEVELAPIGARGRIRGLQAHGQPIERAEPGWRVAVNLAGLTVDKIERGMVLCLPGTVPAARYLDLRVRAIRSNVYPTGKEQEEPLLTHNMPIALHTGAAEAQGILRLLDADQLGPGEEGWGQIRLEQPLAALRGARCILRIPSPAMTVAGGSIVAINPPRHRRFTPEILQRLEALAVATPQERVLDVLAVGAATVQQIAARTDLREMLVRQSVTELLSMGKIVLLGERSVPQPALAVRSYLTTRVWLEASTQRAHTVLEHYHRRYPLRRGMAGETLREELAIERRVWSALLEQWRLAGSLAVDGDLLWLPDHQPQLTPAQESIAAALLQRLDEQPFAPVIPEESGVTDDELLLALAERDDIVRLAGGIILRRDAYERMRDMALETIDREGQVTVAVIRDRFSTSRKYALALLEHLDGLHLTRRVGDGRVRGPAGLVTFR